MSEKTILVIDDSATIRRLVDSTLSAAGYRVLLAPNAELGLQMADQARPDLILLDHQLPGTTGFEVCRQLHEHPELMHIPVVISSTLRKRAYAEYTECANVVDMLPKPYAAELLSTTVANALDTGAMVVKSQSQGAAVPEVIEDPGEADLAGTFRAVQLREVLDFLNNANKRGLLEIEAERYRVGIYLESGRVQAVCASGIQASDLLMLENLPESLHSLAPVLNFTMAGRSCAQVDGLVQLLDRKVLDPRLLQRLLRYQAATLLLRSFREPLKEFRFFANRLPPPLYHKLGLDVSVLALLIDGTQLLPAADLPAEFASRVFMRRAIRGQNLDRAGVAAQHVKLLGQLSESQSVEQLAAGLAMKAEEVTRVCYALVLAELIDGQVPQPTRQVLALEADAGGAQQLRLAFDESTQFTGRVVRDRLTLQLVLRRTTPAVLLVALDHPECRTLASELQARRALPAAQWIGIHAATDAKQAIDGLKIDHYLSRPYTASQVSAAIPQWLGTREAAVTDLESSLLQPSTALEEVRFAEATTL